MKKNILFIVDGSLRNPILQSQGFPFLYNLNHNKYKSFVLSFEETNISKEESLEFQSIIKRYDSKINFLPVTINKKGILPSWFYFFWQATFELNSLVRNNRIDLLHARSFFPVLLSIIIKSFFDPSIKVVYDNRGLYIDEKIFSGHIKKASIKEKSFRWFEKYAVKNCDSLVVVSKMFKKYLLRYYPGLTEKLKNKTVVIPNRTIPHYTESEIYQAKEKIKDKIICIYSGSAVSWQGVKRFHEVFKSILSEMPSTEFKVLTYHPEVFNNNLPDGDVLNNKLSVLSLQPSQIPSELLKSSFGIILREPDIVSQVSSPIKFAEYLAAGLPVLLLEGIGDTEEIIKKYNVGSVIQGNDYNSAVLKMKKLLNASEIVSKCLNAAQNEFDINTTFTEYESIYQNLLFTKTQQTDRLINL